MGGGRPGLRGTWAGDSMAHGGWMAIHRAMAHNRSGQSMRIYMHDQICVPPS